MINLSFSVSGHRAGRGSGRLEIPSHGEPKGVLNFSKLVFGEENVRCMSKSVLTGLPGREASLIVWLVAECSLTLCVAHTYCN